MGREPLPVINRAHKLVKNSHVTWNTQSEYLRYTTLTFEYDIGSLYNINFQRKLTLHFLGKVLHCHCRTLNYPQKFIQSLTHEINDQSIK